MKRRPRRTARGMLPVYRDVHPDRCPVELYCEDGSLGLQVDLPASQTAWLDKQARKKKVTFQTLVCQFVIDAVDKATWGKLD